MDEKMLCMACTLAVAEGRRNPTLDIPELAEGICPDCGGTRGFARESEEAGGIEALVAA